MNRPLMFFLHLSPFSQITNESFLSFSGDIENLNEKLKHSSLQLKDMKKFYLSKKMIRGC